MNSTNEIELALRKFVAPEYIFGIDARKMAPNYCKKLAAEKVFIATDLGLQKTIWLKELENSLQEEKIEYIIFDKISPNPRDYEVMQGAQVYHENKCNIILAIGGGSVMDCAKGIGIVVTNNKRISLFEGIDKIEKTDTTINLYPYNRGYVCRCFAICYY